MPVMRLALRRLREAPATAASQCAALALAIGIPVALQLSASVSADSAYAAAINPSSRDSIATVELQGDGTAENYRRLQAAATRVVADQTGDRLAPIADYATTSSFRVATVNAHPYPLEDLPPLRATVYPALEQKAQLVAGSWPEAAASADPTPVTVSDDSAQFYAWKLGDVVCVTSVDDKTPHPTNLCVLIGGIWRQPTSSDPFWLAAPPVSGLTFAPAGFWSFAPRTQHTTTIVSRAYRPDPARLTVSDAPALETGIRRLRHSLGFGGDSVLTSLDQTIAAFLDRANVNRLPVQLVAAQLILVVLFGLGLLTQNFLAAQTSQCTLWRVRGWSRLDVARYLGAQLLLIALPAALLGTAVAMATTWWQATGYRLDGNVVRSDVASHLRDALVLSVAAAAAVGFALTVRFAWRSVSTMRRAAGSPVTSTWWRTRNADLVLAILALPLLAEAALRGGAAVRVESGVDFIGLALPILALAFLATAAVRLLPLVVQPLRLSSSNIAARLTRWRLGRRPAEHAGIAVLLSLTFAVGLFASIYDTTETLNATDRASYETGADLRIGFSPEAGPDGIRNVIAQIAGIKASMPVMREQIELASSPDAVVALGLDARSYAAAAWSRPGLTTPALGPELAKMSGSPSTIALPGRPDSLSIWVYGLSQPASLAAIVRDRSGQTCRCSFGNLQFDGWRQLKAQIAFVAVAEYPLELERLTIHRSVPGRPTDIAIASLQSVSAGNAVSVDDFSTVRGWWTRDDSGLIAAPGNGGPDWNCAATTGFSIPPGGDINLFPPFRGPLPFLSDQATMTRLALQPGDNLALNVLSHQVVGHLVGAVDYVPTLYPGFVDFVVVPLDRAISQFAAALGESQTPNEVWLSLSAGSEKAAQSIGPNSDVNFAFSRQSQANTAVNDPILIQLRANLVSAFSAALLLAMLAFLVHFVTASRRRLAEHAILEANGLEPDEVRRGIGLEQLSIVLFSVLIGAALAGIAAFVLLPSLQFGAGPEAIEPPTVVHIDWNSLLVAGGIAAAIAFLAASLARRLGARVNVVDEIRRLG